jgi:two-component system, LytTR family, response regulator
MTMHSIRALIVDDEPLARDGVRILLQHIPGIAVAGECPNGRQALRLLKTEEVDLLFLDIQMPEMDGFQVLARIPIERMPVVIFVTAYDQHALRAFRVHALDYVLKPLDEDRFREAVDRAVTMIRQRRVSEFTERLAPLLAGAGSQHAAAARHRYADAIPVPSSGKIILVRTDEIEFIAAADYYAEIHAGKQVYLLRESIASLEQRLDPECFIRIHRSTIVNVRRISSLEPLFDGEYAAVLDTGASLKISKTYLPHIRKQFHIR